MVSSLHLARLIRMKPDLVFFVSFLATLAVNVMLWAGTDPLGRPGCAAWDLFPAEDADKIREFLYEVIARRTPGLTVEKLKETHDE